MAFLKRFIACCSIFVSSSFDLGLQGPLEVKVPNPAELENKYEIPINDELQIKALFHYLIWDCQFAYSLFGNKPISTIAYKKCHDYKYNALSTIDFHNTLPHSWKKWEKLQHLFSQTNHLLICREDNKWLQIYLINRKQCITTISQHLALFQSVLNCTDEEEMIFEKIISSHDLFREGLRSSQKLYGLLLGYGEKNASYFENFHGNKMFFLQSPCLFNLCDVCLPIKLHLPFFMCNPNEDWALITNEYERQRDEILDRYRCGDFLSITLSQLNR